MPRVFGQTKWIFVSPAREEMAYFSGVQVCLLHLLLKIKEYANYEASNTIEKYKAAIKNNQNPTIRRKPQL